MPSPFPGMDPYLEGYLWPDVQSALANKIRQYLTPLLRPRYTARLGIYVVDVYDEAAYELSIDSTAEPPPPALNDAERENVRELLRRG
jgi:hypothetical protein